jgi:hypothetical protein
LTLDGYYKTVLVVGSDLHEEKLNIIYRSTILIDNTVPRYADRVDHKHKVVVLPPGVYSIPFVLDIPADVCEILPASFTTKHGEDSGCIRYDLLVSVETLPTSWFGTSKIKTAVCEQSVDVPRIQNEVLMDDTIGATLLKNEGE